MGPMLALALLASSDYTAALDEIEQQRHALAASFNAADGAGRRALLEQSRRVLLSALVDRIFPAWMGTAWAFNGASRTPRSGEIACGRFVATTLRDAGLQVDLRSLAQQLAIDILRSFAPARTVHWSRTRTLESFAAEARALPDGLYGLGLDQHVGFLLVEKGEAFFVHSSWVAPRMVVREPVAASRALALSRSHVYAPLLGDRVVEMWLRGDRIPVSGR